MTIPGNARERDARFPRLLAHLVGWVIFIGGAWLLFDIGWFVVNLIVALVALPFELLYWLLKKPEPKPDAWRPDPPRDDDP
jgi:hypothetical protein